MTILLPSLQGLGYVSSSELQGKGIWAQWDEMQPKRTPQGAVMEDSAGEGAPAGQHARFTYKTFYLSL